MTAPGGGNDITIVVNARDNATVTLGNIGRNARRLDSDTARLADNLGLLPFNLDRFAAVGVPAIGAVGQAAAAAGPLLLSLAAAGGAVALGMDGIKAAAESIAPQFEAMKASVSDVFEKQLTPVMEKLANGVFPTLTAGMEQMALSLSAVAGDMVGFLASEEGVGKLRDTLGGASAMINGMRPGLVAAVDMLLTMGQAAAPAMEELGAAIGSVFTELNSQIQFLASEGTFQAAIEGFAATVRGLGEVVAAVFGAIVEMGAGLGDGLGAALSVVADIINGLAPLLGALAQGVGVALEAIARAVGPVVEALTPIVALLGEALRGAIDALTPVIMVLADTIGSVLATAVTALQPVFEALVPVITQLATITGTVLTAALTALQPLFDALGPIVKVFADALIAMLPAITQIATAMGEALIQSITALAPVFQQLADIAVQLAPVVAELAVQIGQFLADAIVAITPLIPVIVQAFVTILDAIIPLIPPLIDLASNILPLLPPVFQAIIDVINILVPIIATIITVLAEVIAAIITFCTQTGAEWEQLKADTENTWNLIKALPGQAIDAAVRYVTEKVNTFVADLSAQWEQLKADAKAKFDEAVKNMQDAFDIDWAAIGQSIIDGIIGGISSGAGRLAEAAANAARDAYNAAKSWLGIASPSKLFRDEIGEQMTAGMVVGINRTAGNVAQAVRGAAGGALAGLGDVVKYGSVDDATWKQLMGAGWKGRAGDGMEALYRPGGGGGGFAAAAGGGGSGATVHFSGNTTDALATVIMGMVRTGKIQIRMTGNDIRLGA
jgi:phage-related protein